MRFTPETDSARNAYALWYSAANQTRVNIADINLNVFEDMKRFCVMDPETGEVTTPFYTEEMQNAYDPVLNPQPHMDALKQNFNMEYLTSHAVYVYDNGSDMPRKLKYTGNEFITIELTEEEKKIFAQDQENRKAEAEKQRARSILESTLDLENNAMDTYRTFYGKKRPHPKKWKKLKHASYEEKVMFGSKRKIDVSKDKKITDDLSDEEVALLTIAAHFTEDVSMAGENKEGTQIYLLPMYLDSLANGREGYNGYETNNKAHEIVRKAAADLQANKSGDHGKFEKLGKLLAKGLNNFAYAQRSFTFSTKGDSPYMSKSTIADTITTVRMIEFLDSRLDLRQEALHQGLKEESLVVMRAAANAYKLETGNMHTIDEMIHEKEMDLSSAKEKLTKILIDRMMVHSFSEQIEQLNSALNTSKECINDLQEATRIAERAVSSLTGKKKQIRTKEECDKVFAKYYLKKKEQPLLDIEKNFADFRRLEVLRNQLQKEEYVQKKIREIVDSCKTAEDIIRVLTQKDAVKLSMQDKEKINQLMNQKVPDRTLREQLAARTVQPYSTFRVPENLWERKQFIEKIRKPAEKMGINLNEAKVNQMIYGQFSPKLQKEAKYYLNWKERQQSCYESYKRYLDGIGRKVNIGNRFIFFLLDASGTEQADQNNKDLLKKLTVPSGNNKADQNNKDLPEKQEEALDPAKPTEEMVRQVLNICKDLLTMDLTVFTSPENLDDPVRKMEYYKKNCRILQLAWVVKQDIVDDMKEFVPAGIRNAIMDRAAMLQGGSSYDEMLKDITNEFSWFWANLTPEEQKKITTSESFRNEDSLRWLTSLVDEDAEVFQDDGYLANSLSNFVSSYLHNDEKPETISDEEIRKWTAEGMLSPYKQIYYDGKPIDINAAMLKVKQDKNEMNKLKFSLRPDKEIEEIHAVIKDAESEIDKQIYAAYRKERGLKPEVPQEKKNVIQEDIISTDSVKQTEKAAEEKDQEQKQEPVKKQIVPEVSNVIKEEINTDLVRKPEVKDAVEEAVQEPVQQPAQAENVLQEAVNVQVINPVPQEAVQPVNPPVQQPAEQAEQQPVQAPEKPAEVHAGPEEEKNLKAYLKELMVLNKALKHTDPIAGKAGSDSYMELQYVLERQINVLQVPEYRIAAMMKESLNQIAEQCDKYMFEHSQMKDLSSRQQNRLKIMNRLMDLKEYFDDGLKLDPADNEIYKRIIASKIIQSKAKYCQNRIGNRIDMSDEHHRSFGYTGRMLQLDRDKQKHALNNLLKNDQVFEVMTGQPGKLKEMAAQPGADLLKEYGRITNLDRQNNNYVPHPARPNEKSREQEEKEIKQLLKL